MREKSGGEGGIRTPGTSFSSYNGLANRRIRPLCHLSVLKTNALLISPSDLLPKFVAYFLVAASLLAGHFELFHGINTSFGQRLDVAGLRC